MSLMECDQCYEAYGFGCVCNAPVKPTYEQLELENKELKECLQAVHDKLLSPKNTGAIA